MSLDFARTARLALPLLFAASACVIHTDEWPLGDEADASIDNADLYAEPGQAMAGDQALLELWDNAGQVNFAEVTSIRPLGDFEILEWSGSESHLELVVDVGIGARNEQVIAVDFVQGTAFATFDAM